MSVSNRAIAAKLAGILLFYGVLLFGSAGTLRWPAAWLFLLLHLLFSSSLVVWLKRNDPELLKERMAIFKKPAKVWDRLYTIGAAAAYIALLAITGLDARRHHWSDPPLLVQVLAFLGFAPSFVLFFLVMRENRYLSRVVEIQRDRGHKVVTTGPYQYVRHPMYVAAIVFFFCIPLALGSLYGLLLSCLMATLIVLRTVLEDRTLYEELPGYKEYAAKTRYRLLPGVW